MQKILNLNKMKKLNVNVLVILALFTTSSIFYSCSRDIENDAIERSKVEFLNELEFFNSNYQLNIIDKQKKQSLHAKKKCNWWCKLKNVLVVASYDIIGAGAGAAAVQVVAAGLGVATGGTGYAIVTGAAAIITGAGASIDAANSLEHMQLNEDDTGGPIAAKSSKTFGKKMITENLDIRYPPQFDNLKDIGKLHNEEVNTFYNKKKSKLAKIKGNNILDSKEFIKINNEIKSSVKKYVANDFNTDGLISELLNKNLVSENMALVFNKFFKIYNNSEKRENIQDIVNFYISAIANTNVLSDADKTALISSFSVASESPFYWLNQK